MLMMQESISWNAKTSRRNIQKPRKEDKASMSRRSKPISSPSCRKTDTCMSWTAEKISRSTTEKSMRAVSSPKHAQWLSNSWIELKETPTSLFLLLLLLKLIEILRRMRELALNKIYIINWLVKFILESQNPSHHIRRCLKRGTKMLDYLSQNSIIWV